MVREGLFNNYKKYGCAALKEKWQLSTKKRMDKCIWVYSCKEILYKNKSEQ